MLQSVVYRCPAPSTGSGPFRIRRGSGALGGGGRAARARLGYRPGMLLRVFRLLNRWYSLALFWGYLGAFALALTMTFVFFPIGAIAILLLSLMALPVLFLAGAAFRFAERRWTAAWLHAGRCPSCRGDGCVAAVAGEVPADSRYLPEAPAAFACERCGCRYSAAGEWLESLPDESPDEDGPLDAQRVAAAAA